MRLDLEINFLGGEVSHFDHVRNIHYFNDGEEIRIVVSQEDDTVYSYLIRFIESMVLTPEEIDE